MKRFVAIIAGMFAGATLAQAQPTPNWGGSPPPAPIHNNAAVRSLGCYAYSTPAGWQVQCGLACNSAKATYDASHPAAKAIGCAATIYCRGGKCFADEALCQSVTKGPCDGYSSTGPVSVGVKPPPPPTGPSLSTLSRASGYPGDELVLTGQRFGTSPGTVLFKEHGGSREAAGRTMDWSDGRIRVLVEGYQRSTTVDSQADVVVVRSDYAHSNSRPFTLQKQKVQNCYAYSTKGGDRYQIACQPDADSCNSALARYKQQNGNKVDLTGCSQAVSCYWYGLDINKAEANVCFTSAAECQLGLKNDFKIGTKSAFCYDQSNPGPAKRY